MSDLQAYISERLNTDPEFAEGYEEGFRNFGSTGNLVGGFVSFV
jgi:hypothetical protein